MEELDLEFIPDINKTAKRANYFLRVDFQRFLNLSGMHKNQLSSPALSLAPGSTNLNHIEDDILHSIEIAEPAKRAVSAIYKSMDNCTQSPEKTYRAILILTYVDNLPINKIAVRTNLAERTVSYKKKSALCKFADRLEYWKRVFKIEELPDLRTF